MPDEVRFNQELGIIEIESYGEVSRGDIAESIEKVEQIREETGIGKLFVDTTAQQKLPNPVELFEIFSAFPRKYKAAILMQCSQITAGDVEFLETVAINRGKSLKIHGDREQALQWLAED